MAKDEKDSCNWIPTPPPPPRWCCNIIIKQSKIIDWYLSRNWRGQRWEDWVTEEIWWSIYRRWNLNRNFMGPYLIIKKISVIKLGWRITSFKVSIYLEQKILISKLKSRMSLIQVKASNVGPGPNVEVNLYFLLMFYIFM